MKRPDLDLIQVVATAAHTRGLSWGRVREVPSTKSGPLMAGGSRSRDIARSTNVRPAPLSEGARGGVREAMVGEVRPGYTVTAERGEGWWAIRVVELPGVFSQARRLDRVEAMARDAVGLLLDIPSDSFDVTVREVLSDEARRVVAAAIQARAEALERQELASATSREAVRTLTRLGLPQRDIGRLLGLSHQRVGQLAGDDSRLTGQGQAVAAS